MQTLITFGKIIDRIEESIQKTEGDTVRLDVRIYNDYVALRDDLANGEVHFASVDGPMCLAAQALEPAVSALVCDKRPGLPTVIFVPADSDITNLAGLKGHALAIPDKVVNPFVLVFAQLAEAGLCARDVRCSLVTEVDGEVVPKRIAIRRSQGGSYGSKNSAQRSVFETKSSDAGVAFERQLKERQEGREWRRLVTFPAPDFLWVAGPRTDTAARDAFARALQRFRNPQDLESVLVDTDTDGFAYTTATENYLESFRAAGRAQERFQQCLPTPTNGTPSRLPNQNLAL